MGVRLSDNKILWQSKPEPIASISLAASHGKVYYSNYKQVVCLDRTSGKELWRSQPVETAPSRRATCGTLVAQKEVVLYSYPIPRRSKKGGNNSGQLVALSAETGKLLWEGPKYQGLGAGHPADLFVIDGLVWIGDDTFPVDQREAKVDRRGFAPLSGEVMREISVPYLKTPGHHARCYRTKATERFLMLPKRGVEFLDLKGNDHMRNDWLRPTCYYGALPANGMLYISPHPCVCCPGVMLSNFNALTARTRPPSPDTSAEEERLLRGPAWGKVAKAAVARDSDWPTYRRDPVRSGHARTTVPVQPKLLWDVPRATAITPPIAAAGRVVVAETNTHSVVAMDGVSGKMLWRYTAGARIDSPPTIHEGLVLFGCADGWVYCLQNTDGVEVWRFRAAPEDRRVLVDNQLESAWPVPGSVLIQPDLTDSQKRSVAYLTAGRSSFLDGGIRVYGLDPHTGATIHQTLLDGPHADPLKEKAVGNHEMDGSKSDILVSDGSDVFLFQERLTGSLERVPSDGRHAKYPSPPGPGTRLIATGGFLDDTYNEGLHWTYGEWPGFNRLRGGFVPQLMVFDDNKLFGVDAFTEKVRMRKTFIPETKGIRVFSRQHGAKEDKWSRFIPVHVRAMVLAGNRLYVAGFPDVVPEDDPIAAFEGRRGGLMLTIAPDSGEILAETTLTAPPVFDGLIAAGGVLFMSTTDGRVLCFGSENGGGRRK